MIRVGSENPCPVCGHSDWCLIAEDNGSAICGRIEEGCDRYISGSGFLHVFNRRTTQAWKGGSWQRPGIDYPSSGFTPCSIDWGEYHRVYTTDLGHRKKGPPEFALSLGLPLDSLLAYGMGITRDGWYTFPMRDHHRVIRGFRLRSTEGKKSSVKGSSQGLHFPETGWTAYDVAYVCEGPTDAAALHAMGLYAIGRPSCMGCERMIARWAADNPTVHIVIMADDDGPGIQGALKLQEELACDTLIPPVVHPPRIKDVREWYKLGAARGDVEALWR